MKKYLLSLLALFILLPAFAGKPFEVKLKNGLRMNVEICSDQIIRVRIAPRDTFSESLLERYKILRTNWDAVDVSEKTSGDITKLFTPTHVISINKKNGNLSIADKNGKTILSNVSLLTSKDERVTSVGKTINTTFADLKVPNNGTTIIGDDESKGSMKDVEETGPYKNNSIIQVALQDGERFYGGGSTSREHIQHRGELLRMWATYQHTEIPQPFILSSNNWGIFNNTTRKNFFDIGKSDKNALMIYNTSDEADFYLLLGNSMRDVISKYTAVTGSPFLLPKWAYGLNFGNNMSEDQFGVLSDAVRFRDEKIPCDMMWLEPQWMEKRYDFSTAKKWNYQKFAGEPYWCVDKYPKTEHPHLFIGRLHGLGYHLCLWLCLEYDLSITAEDELATLAGRPTSGQVHWMDHLTNFVDNGVDGFKMDPARTIDEHTGFKYYNGKSDKEMHNLNQVLLPKQMNQMFRNHKQIRSFQHYTSGWAGTQHWGASTSGDNGGGLTALFDQLNLGMSGFLNTSCDVMNDGNEMAGLHMGLFLPWVQVNSWYSLFQPWYYPAQQRQTYADYVRLRYSLIPYIYSAAIEGQQTGMPIVRAMPLMFPNDRNVDDMHIEYMFGDNLLVGAFSDSIYLPKGIWIDFWTGEKLTGNSETIRHSYPENRAGQLFIREGAIIPFQKPMQYIGEFPLDTLIIRVWPSGKTSYKLLEDDGLTYNYEKGETASTLYECDQLKGNTLITINPTKGNYENMPLKRAYQLECASNKKPTKILVNGIQTSEWIYNGNKILMTLPQKDIRVKQTISIVE